ncbi:MAG: lysine biosynthesis protein LysW [bacterium]
MVFCPECEAYIEIDYGLEIGEIIECPECGAELEIINDDPYEVALPYEDLEDEGFEDYEGFEIEEGNPEE